MEIEQVEGEIGKMKKKEVDEMVYPLFKKPIRQKLNEINLMVEWSGSLGEYSITIESLMKGNNWSREKAKKYLEDMWEEIKNDNKDK